MTDLQDKAFQILRNRLPFHYMGDLCIPLYGVDWATSMASSWMETGPDKDRPGALPEAWGLHQQQQLVRPHLEHGMPICPSNLLAFAISPKKRDYSGSAFVPYGGNEFRLT